MTAYSSQKHLQPLLCCILLYMQYTYINVKCLLHVDIPDFTLCASCVIWHSAMFSGPAPECTLLHHSHCNQWSDCSIKSGMHAESQVNSDDYVMAWCVQRAKGGSAPNILQVVRVTIIGAHREKYTRYIYIERGWDGKGPGPMSLRTGANHLEVALTLVC